MSLLKIGLVIALGYVAYRIYQSYSTASAATGATAVKTTMAVPQNVSPSDIIPVKPSSQTVMYNGQAGTRGRWGPAIQ